MGVRWGPRGLRAVLPMVALLVVLALAGCGNDSANGERGQGDEPGRSYPAGAIVLPEALPTSVDGARYVAYNIGPDSGRVALLEVTQAREDDSVIAERGSTITVGGRRFEVLDVVQNTNEDAAPGSSNGRIVLLPVT